MKILVCVKQVAQTEAPIRIEASGNWIQMDESTPLRMNRYDEFAIEEALLIKEAFPNVSIDVVTVGPARAEMAVKRGLGMGADHGVHICTEQEGYLSPFIIAEWIAAYARDKDYVLLLAGVMSEDGMHGQVGPMVAEHLAMPCATATILERISPDKGIVYAEREMEEGFRDSLELKLPALLTILSGINKPRYPSLSNMLRAKQQRLEIIAAGSLKQPDPRQSIEKVNYPPQLSSGMVLTGSRQQKVRELLQILKEKSFIH
jgi:electron transfer flavoprotein beta subunit